MLHSITSPGSTKPIIEYRLASDNNSVLDEDYYSANPQLLTDHPEITELALYNNQIDDAVAQAFANVLQVNTALTSFTLCIEKVPLEQINQAFSHAFAERIASNNTLTSLTLSCNAISREGISSIFQALKNNNTLTLLNICCKREDVEFDCVTDIAEFLKTNKTLTSLALTGISLNHANIQSFAAALNINNTLTLLKLIPCKIDNVAREAILKAIGTNNTRTSLETDWKICGSIFFSKYKSALDKSLKILVNQDRPSATYSLTNHFI